MTSPLALTSSLRPGYQADDPAALVGPSVTVTVGVHPDLASLLDSYGSRRRGRSCSFPPDRAGDLTRALNTSSFAEHVTDGDPQTGSCAAPGGRVVTERTNTGRLTVSVTTDGFALDVDPLTGGPIDLDRHPAGRRSKGPLVVAGAVALQLAEAAAGHVPVDVRPAGSRLLDQLRAAARSSCVLLPRAGEPARATALVGHDAARARGLLKQRRGGFVGAAVQGVPADTMVPTLEQQARLCRLPAERFHAGDATLDILTMARARPYTDDERLRAYQADTVGVHLATRVGFVNCIDPGLGKTVTTLVGWAARARQTVRWRGLAVVETSVRDQWAAEAQVWFPDAEVCVVRGRGDLEVVAARCDQSDSPVLVVVTYATLTATVGAHLAAGKAAAGSPSSDESPDGPRPGERFGRWLLGVGFDDIAADEAVVLRNPDSKTSQALWAVRATVQVAVALSGTPILNDLDDLAELIAWARSERTLFGTFRPSRRFDLTSPRQRAQFLDAVGPLLVRHTKAAVPGELPTIEPSVVTLHASGDEQRLLAELTGQLRQLRDDLARATGSDRRAMSVDERSEHTARLRRLRTSCLSMMDLIRSAVNDRGSLVESSSPAVARVRERNPELICRSASSTKRSWVRDYAGEQASAGRQVLVFASSPFTADQLVTELELDGVAAVAVTGSAARQRTRAVQAFQSGEVDVLVATAAAERGLNLQSADVIVHLDLPRTVQSAWQRVGRVDRLGGPAASVTVVFCVLANTPDLQLVDDVVDPCVASLARGATVDAAVVGPPPTRTRSPLTVTVDRFLHVA